MQVRYYDDPRSGQPHIYGHNVAEYEVEAVLDRPMEDRPGEGEVRIALGQTERRPLFTSRLCSRSHSNSVFVITAYELGPKGEASPSPQT